MISSVHKIKALASLGWLEKVGWAMWVVGMAVELTADYQKHVFRSNKANSEDFIKTGLWAISRSVFTLEQLSD